MQRSLVALLAASILVLVLLVACDGTGPSVVPGSTNSPGTPPGESTPSTGPTTPPPRSSDPTASSSPPSPGSGSTPAGPAARTLTTEGPWGGDHAELRIQAGGEAFTEFDCAVGSISGPLAVAEDGSFGWEGSFAPERGNPIAQGDATPYPATYHGTVSGSTMVLTVDVPSLDHTEGPFTLHEGERGFLRKCQ